MYKLRTKPYHTNARKYWTDNPDKQLDYEDYWDWMQKEFGATKYDGPMGELNSWLFQTDVERTWFALRWG